MPRRTTLSLVSAHRAPSPRPQLLAIVPLALATAFAALSARDPADVRRSRDRALVAGPAPAQPRSAAVVALILHGLVAFPYLTSVLLAPTYGVALLWALWGAFLVAAVQLARTRALLALAYSLRRRADSRVAGLSRLYVWTPGLVLGRPHGIVTAVTILRNDADAACTASPRSGRG